MTQFGTVIGRIGYWALLKTMAVRDRAQHLEVTVARWGRGLDVIALQREFGISLPDARAAIDYVRSYEGARQYCQDAARIGLGVRDHIHRLQTVRDFPCGCSRVKVDAGQCGRFAPGETPSPWDVGGEQCAR